MQNYQLPHRASIIRRFPIDFNIRCSPANRTTPGQMTGFPSAPHKNTRPSGRGPFRTHKNARPQGPGADQYALPFFPGNRFSRALSLSPRESLPPRAVTLPGNHSPHRRFTSSPGSISPYMPSAPPGNPGGRWRSWPASAPGRKVRRASPRRTPWRSTAPWSAARRRCCRRG